MLQNRGKHTHEGNEHTANADKCKCTRRLTHNEVALFDLTSRFVEGKDPVNRGIISAKVTGCHQEGQLRPQQQKKAVFTPLIFPLSPLPHQENHQQHGVPPAAPQALLPRYRRNLRVKRSVSTHTSATRSWSGVEPQAFAKPATRSRMVPFVFRTCTPYCRGSLAGSAHITMALIMRSSLSGNGTLRYLPMIGERPVAAVAAGEGEGGGGGAGSGGVGNGGG